MTPLDAEGRSAGTALLAFTTPFHGTGILNVDNLTGTAATQLQVEADGPWTITMSSLHRAPTWDVGKPLTGDAPKVLVVPGGLADERAATFAVSDDDTIASLTFFGASGRIGSFLAGSHAQGHTTIPAGTVVIAIEGVEHSWTITPE